MLLIKILCFILFALLEFFVIKKLLNSSIKLLSFRNLFLISILVIISLFLYEPKHYALYTLSIYMFSIVIYKYIFNKKLYNITILVSIFFMLMIISDIIISIVIILLGNFDKVNSYIYFKLILNFLVFILTLYISNLYFVQMKLKTFINKFILKLFQFYYFTSDIYSRKR